jgi:leucyl aminopeptidase (aminopeptidase T)
LEEHRAVLATIRSLRARYDHARTARAVDKAQSEMPAAIADVQRRITHIDQWGNNSKLLGDYAAMLSALEQPYRTACKSAIAGDAAALDTLKAE